MPNQSAGLVMFRIRDRKIQVFLVHPGGPFWAKKDDHAWSIPKGEYGAEEDALAAACREFQEETGGVAEGDFITLTPIRQPSRKLISAWAIEGNMDPASLKSNTFFMEWPPHSNLQQEFPEVDRAEWFDLDRARIKIIKGQAGFIDELEQYLATNRAGSNIDKR
jgi:predicted NUDIX family NTP pyrophosphohydrolase